MEWLTDTSSMHVILGEKHCICVFGTWLNLRRERNWAVGRVSHGTAEEMCMKMSDGNSVRSEQ